MNLKIYTLEEAKEAGFTTFYYSDGEFDEIDYLESGVTGYLLKLVHEQISFKGLNLFKPEQNVEVEALNKLLDSVPHDVYRRCLEPLNEWMRKNPIKTMKCVGLVVKQKPYFLKED